MYTYVRACMYDFVNVENNCGYATSRLGRETQIRQWWMDATIGADGGNHCT